MSTMSGSKAALKAINDAIRQQKFDDAVAQAQEFIKKESKNYQGYRNPDEQPRGAHS